MTTRGLYKLWRHFNRVVFNDVLVRPTRITCGPAEPEVEESLGGPLYGYCEGFSRGRVSIHIDPRLCTSTSMVESTLLHEMVHQYQHQHGLDMDHDTSFEAWRPAVRELTGYAI